MRRLQPILLLAALVAAGCGSSPASTPSTTSVPATTRAQVPVSPAPTTVTVYRVQGGTIAARSEHVPHTTAVASSALGALGLAAPVTIANGSAQVTLADATADQIAEIVFTLTQFPTVSTVDVAGRTGLTRADFDGYLPTIFIDAPAADAEVPATFHISGSAQVFEATFVVELVRGGSVLEKETVTASEGAPGRGSFDTTLHAPSSGDAIVRAFAPSAANGSPQHLVDVPVTVTP
jgi:hypothetical protein